MKTVLNYIIVLVILAGILLAMKGMTTAHLGYATLSLVMILVAYLLDRKANPEDYKR